MRLVQYDTELEGNLPRLVAEKEVCAEHNMPEYLDIPAKIVDVLNNSCQLNKKTEEHLYMLALNTKAIPIGIFLLAKGRGNVVCCSPREVYMKALLSGAMGIILIHNHPSGVAQVSQEDMDLQKRMVEAGKLIGIELLDFIIVAGNTYFSSSEEEKKFP